MIADIIAKLRAANTSLGARVAGISELKRAAEQNLKLPCAYVILKGEKTVKHPNSLNVGSYKLEKDVHVMCVVDATPDRRGQAAVTDMESLRNEVLGAFHGWRPADNFGVLVYAGLDLDDDLKDRVAYHISFKIQEQLSPECYAHGSLPSETHLQGANLNVAANYEQTLGIASQVWEPMRL